MLATVLAAVCLIAAENPIAADSTNAAPQHGPLRATIARGGAIVRGGPGADFPAAVRLPAGAAVEVYKALPNGWCAIRPPRGSVSFVRENLLRQRSKTVGEAAVDQVASQLGDDSGSPTDVFQVRLKQGEQVHLVSPEPVGGWWKIAPPSGEFRWVHRDELATDRSRGEPPRLDDRPFPPPRELAAGPLRDVAPAPPGEDNDLAASPVPLDAKWEQSREIDFAAELGAIELALAKEVCESPEAWRLSELANRARMASRYADETIERARARRLVDRIERFAEIQQGLLALHAARPPQSAVAAKPTEFAVTGSLRRVPGPGGGSSYALEDSFGRITYYLDGATESELAPYLGRPLAVWGRRGYSTVAGAQILRVERLADAAGVVR